MFDATDIVLMIKQASLDTYKSLKATEICYGTVESISPLQISIDEKLKLRDVQLVLTRNVTDYDVEITENSIGTKTYTVKNALKQNEKVVLIRVQGGQKYLVSDRVV